MSSTPMVTKVTKRNKQKYAQDIAEILRQNYMESDSAIKHIARRVELSPSTIKTWYEGRKLPSLENFIILTKAYPDLQKWFFDQTNNDAINIKYNHQNQSESMDKDTPDLDVFCLNFETPHFNIDLKAMQKLKLRQLWLYARVLKSESVGIQDLINNFNISRATAYRDIEELEHFNLIFKSTNHEYDRYIAKL
jgi:predicted transcriptional regulator